MSDHYGICESGGTGRRARLRGVWLHRTGSSPVSRTKKASLTTCFFLFLIQKKPCVSNLCLHKAFLTYRKLRKPDLAVLPRLSARKATIGELGDAGTARFFTYRKKSFFHSTGQAPSRLPFLLLLFLRGQEKKASPKSSRSAINVHAL